MVMFAWTVVAFAMIPHRHGEAKDWQRSLWEAFEVRCSRPE
jgi:hypothetical protein